MRFLSRIIGPAAKTSRARQERSPHLRRRSRIDLESLESRDLMTSIPGVSVYCGNLAIVAPLHSGNQASVSIDTTNHNYVKVALNGQSKEFAPNLVTSVTYEGGYGGKDTFANDTNLVTLAYGFGSGNAYTGSSGCNYVYFWGTNNTYNAQAGSLSDVFEIGGTDTINNPDGATVYIYY